MFSYIIVEVQLELLLNFNLNFSSWCMIEVESWDREFWEEKDFSNPQTLEIVLSIIEMDSTGPDSDLTFSDYVSLYKWSVTWTSVELELLVF